VVVIRLDYQYYLVLLLVLLLLLILLLYHHHHYYYYYYYYHHHHLPAGVQIGTGPVVDSTRISLMLTTSSRETTKTCEARGSLLFTCKGGEEGRGGWMVDDVVVVVVVVRLVLVDYHYSSHDPYYSMCRFLPPFLIPCFNHTTTTTTTTSTTTTTITATSTTTTSSTTTPHPIVPHTGLQRRQPPADKEEQPCCHHTHHPIEGFPQPVGREENKFFGVEDDVIFCFRGFGGQGGAIGCIFGSHIDTGLGVSVQHECFLLLLLVVGGGG